MMIWGLSIILLLPWISQITGNAFDNSLILSKEVLQENYDLYGNVQKEIETQNFYPYISARDTYDGRPSFHSEAFNSTIIGKEMRTIKNRTIYAFQGFRYGKAPTGKRRFKPPVAADKFWDGEAFEAVHIGFKCPQHAMIGNGIAGNEDCLFLNVYTPYLPTNSTKDALPVMFFIHGGSFTYGDATAYLPTKLLDHDVILVTIHYRLGSLGFFCMNNPDAPCNAALYDMVEALRWTQKYIEDFGGDKDKVTIFGQSAGAASVNYLMLVQQAQGLFRGVIADSGSALEIWAIDDNPLFAAKYIANYVGCPTDDDTDMFNCVVEADASELTLAQLSLVDEDRHKGGLGFRGVSPSVQNFTLEGDEGYDLLLTMHPRQYFEEGNFSNVPLMTGSNRQEGSYVFGVMYYDFLVYNGLLDNEAYMREEFIQDALKTYGTSDETYSIADSLQMEYCYGIDLADFDAALPCFIDMLGAMYLKSGSWETCNLNSYYTDKKTYYYSFEFESDDSMMPFILETTPFDAGITHTDELMYLFSMPALMDTEAQVKTMDRMTKLWTNFAIYGEPTPIDDRDNLDKLGIPDWTPYQFEDHNYMLIQDELSIKKEYTDRWTVSVDQLNESDEENEEPECEGLCQDYEDKKQAFEISMIVFAVSCVFLTMIAIYFFFKSRR